MVANTQYLETAYTPKTRIYSSGIKHLRGQEIDVISGRKRRLTYMDTKLECRACHFVGDVKGWQMVLALAREKSINDRELVNQFVYACPSCKTLRIE